ncbi:MAG: FAD-binding protein [Bacteroidales bacterium]|nr:FAD-binding protein [Bacteroidales bacterium]
MIQEFDIRVAPQTAATEANLREWLVREKNLQAKDITGTRILKRSIDARQRQVWVQLRVRVYLNEPPEQQTFPPIEYPEVRTSKEVIVVGAGPAGLFAALRLLELGIRPIVVERGKNVRDRKKDLAQISRNHRVDPESNYSFGEGGAGAYSDGKLYTRSKKRGNVEKILQVFCQFGASPSILIDAHPHIGTDKLPGIIEAMRNQILSCGGEVHFETRMEDLILHNGRVCGIVCNTGQRMEGPVILATGHSARDVYRLLFGKNIRQSPKGLAMGVRLEHPQHRIDQIQYHNNEGRGLYLPAAEYSLVTQIEGRGVYSFCMCPGGFVVPAASGPEQVVVNGMSPSNRGSKWANAGLVVELHPEDAGKQHVLCMLEMQEKLEKACFLAGGQTQTAPAQRMLDFTENRRSIDLPPSSYSPGLCSSPLHEWMPKGIVDRLQKGFQVFQRNKPGFLSNEAVLIGVETRTSSPVRIDRNPVDLQHVDWKGLYPCGEGAGYAGGIVSAAIDGERCAEQAALELSR